MNLTLRAMSKRGSVVSGAITNEGFVDGAKTQSETLTPFNPTSKLKKPIDFSFH